MLVKRVFQSWNSKLGKFLLKPRIHLSGKFASRENNLLCSVVLSQSLCCKYRASNKKLLMLCSFRLHSEFYAEKYSKVLLWNAWNVLTRMQRGRKEQILYVGDIGPIKLLPVPNCLILHTSLMACRGVYKLHCYM